MPDTPTSLIPLLFEAIAPQVVLEIGARDSDETRRLSELLGRSGMFYSIAPTVDVLKEGVGADSSLPYVLHPVASWESMKKSGSSVDLAIVRGRQGRLAIIGELRHLLSHADAHRAPLPPIVFVGSGVERSSYESDPEFLQAIDEFRAESGLSLHLLWLEKTNGGVLLFGEQHSQKLGALAGYEADDLSNSASGYTEVTLESASALLRRCLELEAAAELADSEHNKDLLVSRLRQEQLEQALHVLPQESLTLSGFQTELLAARAALAQMTEERDAWRDFGITSRGRKTGGSNETVVEGPLVVEQAIKVLPARVKPQLQADSRVAPTRLAGRVDLIVCIYNALEDVDKCVESVALHRDLVHRLILVDDASRPATRQFLQRWKEENGDWVDLVVHKTNKGYTASVNSGLSASTAEFVVLLNSDTLVTEGWLRRMVNCAESDHRIGIVGPLSNAASWQNVPQLFAPDGKFAINEIPPGHTIESFSELVAGASLCSRPRVPFVNGFCYLIRRTVIEKVGLFDVDSFPRGYGEENDYSLRTAAAGFSLAIADDAYVFHSKSKSFGHEERTTLSASGMAALIAKHGRGRVDAQIEHIKKNTSLSNVRERVVTALASDAPVRSGTIRDFGDGERILFLLPVEGRSGGAHSVVQEVSGMRELGVRASVAVPQHHREGYLREYSAMPRVGDMIIGFDAQDLEAIASQYTVLVSTIFTSVTLIEKLCAENPSLLAAYYIQDYEPYFVSRQNPRYREAINSYSLIPGAVRFAKTQWLIDIVGGKHGVAVHKVSPSLDHSTYMPRDRAPRESVKIVAMIRPATPRRAPRRTMKVMGQVQKLRGDRVDLHIFGCSEDDPNFEEVRRLARCQNHGRLSRNEVSALLADADIFIDLSDYQAFGRTGLEAMACGAAVINPRMGGAGEYCISGENSLLVDTTHHEECVGALLSLVDDDDLRNRIARNGLRTAQAYSIQIAARSELTVLQRAATEHRADLEKHRPHRVKAVVETHRDGQISRLAQLRIVAPYRKIPRRQQTFVLSPLKDIAQGGGAKRCEFVVVQAGAVGQLAQATALIERCRLVHTRVVYDVDGLDLDIDSSGEFLTTRNERTLAARYLAEHADVVVASSGPLVRAYQERNEYVCLIPNALDDNLWSLDSARVREHWGGRPLRIGVVTSGAGDLNFEVVRSALLRVASEYGARVSIEIVGGDPSMMAQLSSQFRCIPLPSTNSYPDQVEWLKRYATWDIGLIPILGVASNGNVSTIQFLEFCALGMASVCSDLPSYREVVQDEKNGLLVSNDADVWYDSIVRLIENPTLRVELAKQALQDLRDHHTAAHRADAIAEVFESASKRRYKAVLGKVDSARLASVALAISEQASGSSRKQKSTMVVHRGSSVERKRNRPGAFLGDSKFSRKLRKLMRDPAAFIADYKFLRRTGPKKG